MGDDEIRQQALDAIGGGEAEDAAEADPVGDQDEDRRQAAGDTEGDREKSDQEVVGHDQDAGRGTGVGGDVGPGAVVLDQVDDLGRGDVIGELGVGEDENEGDQGGTEEKQTGRRDERPAGAIGSGQGPKVELGQAAAHVAAAAIYDRVAEGDEPVQVGRDRLRRPVSPGPSEVGRGLPVETGEGEHVLRLEAAEPASAAALEKVLQSRPVGAPAIDEFLRSHLGITLPVTVNSRLRWRWTHSRTARTMSSSSPRRSW